MKSEQSRDLDLDEDLFDFAVQSSASEGDIDIAEFLSSIDDSDASAILDLADEDRTQSVDLSEVDEEAVEAALAGRLTTSAAPRAETAAAPQVVVQAPPIWKQPMALVLVGTTGVLLLTNLIGTWITWNENRSVTRDIESARIAIQTTVDRATQDLQRETARLGNLTQPSTSSLLGPNSFKVVEQHLAAGDWPSARRMLYAKLALVDRLPVDERDAVESHALFMLAETDRQESLALATEGDD